jgi:hypothetical protein
MKKTELYEIIKLKKPEPVYKTDEFVYSDQYISVVSPSLS